MTTDKHCGQVNQPIHFTGSLAEAHKLSALEQSACYEAQLAIARWINASALSAFPPPSPAQLARAAWFSQAQQNFQEWLGRGGFAQYEPASNDEVCPPAAGEDGAGNTPCSDLRPLGFRIDVDIL